MAVVPTAATAARNTYWVTVAKIWSGTPSPTPNAIARQLAAGRRVVDQATARRRALIADILAKLPADTQRAVAWALRAFADVAGEVPGNQWLSPERADEAGAAKPRRPARSAASAKTSR